MSVESWAKTAGRGNQSLSLAANRNQSVADVASDSTFEGTTVPGFAQQGQNITIGIRKAGELGTLMSSRQLTQAAAVTGGTKP